MDKFTKGPWSIASYSRDGFTESHKVIEDSCENEICRIEYAAMPTGSPGIMASDENAKLIVAAPELLEALRNLVNSLMEQDEDGLTGHSEPMQAAADAIHKATS